MVPLFEVDIINTEFRLQQTKWCSASWDYLFRCFRWTTFCKCTDACRQYITINFAPWNANSYILAWSYKEICWKFILCDMLKKHTPTIFHFQLKILPSNLWIIFLARSILRNIIEGKYLRYIRSQRRRIWRGIWKKYVRVRRVGSLFFKR